MGLYDHNTKMTKENIENICECGHDKKWHHVFEKEWCIETSCPCKKFKPQDLPTIIPNRDKEREYIFNKAEKEKPQNHSQAEDTTNRNESADTLSDKGSFDVAGYQGYVYADTDVKEFIKRLNEDVLTEVHLYPMISKKGVVKIINKIFGDKLA